MSVRKRSQNSRRFIVDLPGTARCATGLKPEAGEFPAGRAELFGIRPGLVPADQWQASKILGSAEVFGTKPGGQHRLAIERNFAPGERDNFPHTPALQGLHPIEGSIRQRRLAPKMPRRESSPPEPRQGVRHKRGYRRPVTGAEVPAHVLSASSPPPAPSSSGRARGRAHAQTKLAVKYAQRVSSRRWAVRRMR